MGEFKPRNECEPKSGTVFGRGFVLGIESGMSTISVKNQELIAGTGLESVNEII